MLTSPTSSPITLLRCTLLSTAHILLCTSSQIYVQCQSHLCLLKDFARILAYTLYTTFSERPSLTIQTKIEPSFSALAHQSDYFFHIIYHSLFLFIDLWTSLLFLSFSPLSPPSMYSSAQNIVKSQLTFLDKIVLPLL